MIRMRKWNTVFTPTLKEKANHLIQCKKPKFLSSNTMISWSPFGFLAFEPEANQIYKRNLQNPNSGSLTVCSSNNPDAGSSNSLTKSSSVSFFSKGLTAATRRRTKKTPKLLLTICFWIPIPSVWYAFHFTKGLNPLQSLHHRQTCLLYTSPSPRD